MDCKVHFIFILTIYFLKLEHVWLRHSTTSFQTSAAGVLVLHTHLARHNFEQLSVAHNSITSVVSSKLETAILTVLTEKRIHVAAFWDAAVWCTLTDDSKVVTTPTIHRPDHGGSNFFSNVRNYLPDYMTKHPR